MNKLNKNNNGLIVKFGISILICGFELFYTFIISNFFSDKSIAYYFDYFKYVRFFFILTPLATWFISAYTFSNMLYNKYLYFKPENKNKNVKKFSRKYEPSWPEYDDFQLVIGEVHNRDGSRKEKPEWLIMDKNGLYTGLIIFGATGTGKTTACAYPFFDQLVNCKKRVETEKIGGLILDVKGDFWKEAVRILERNGRQRDIVIIEPGSGYYFNPIHYPHLDAKVIAERLYSVIENMNSNDGRQDSYWKDKSINLLANSIGLIRSCFGYVTLSDIYEIIADEIKLKNMLEYAGNLINEKEGCADEIRLAAAYFTGGDFFGLDERTKAIIKSESMRVCSDFIKPLYKETFCSPEEKLNFPGFQDVINNGKIVILRMPESKYGLTGKAIGIMLKLDYFRTVLNRVYNAAVDSAVNLKRPVVFICDEYQNYVTSGDIESDAEFFARCRQSKAINIVLTQGYSSLKLKLGSEEKINSLIGNIRSSIWLSLSDDYSREKASKICDKEYKLKITENITEQDDGARFNPYVGGLLSEDNTISQGTTRTYEKMPSFDTNDFADLKLNQAIYRIYSGNGIKGPGIVYLHPIYKPKLKSYFEQ
ncbi:MAG: type IV secretory system conjugative DNA transfer family protein [Deltaproteobacteria bacterium]|nr:type IV secretory system conjugative DNA transfer family protein [Deltaproteobacteria bacterium]MCL5880584.1 type IV secretory system conjugative DNA transfer family protein [Deltaproteobacteria bacterium]MDA8304905.1 type IV secretory system conjugative DNA transfer family protein [Deltaproteobacteria bacterium]